MAIRFHLAEHVHTDIIAHSVDGFPTRTAEEFVEFLQAIYESGSSRSKPTPIETFLAKHPAALRFVQAPKPFPSSFAKESFFSVTAYQFTNSAGVSRYGRYRIVPDDDANYLSDVAAAAESANFLLTEIVERLSREPVKFAIHVQLAEAGDVVDDSTVRWPGERQVVEFGKVEIASVIPDNQAEQRYIIFDPIPRLDGIGTSGDPLLEPRANVYLMSGRQRRSATAAAAG